MKRDRKTHLLKGRSCK